MSLNLNKKRKKKMQIGVMKKTGTIMDKKMKWRNWSKKLEHMTQK